MTKISIVTPTYNEEQNIKILCEDIKKEFEKIILNLWSKHIKNSIVTPIDAKTKLQELSLKKYKKLPIYKLISNTGPRHKPLFKVGVKLYNTKYYYSEGKSKKDAEQNAAVLCLKNLNLV